MFSVITFFEGFFPLPLIADVQELINTDWGLSGEWYGSLCMFGNVVFLE